jgi:hypothetical protein
MVVKCGLLLKGNNNEWRKFYIVYSLGRKAAHKCFAMDWACNLKSGIPGNVCYSMQRKALGRQPFERAVGSLY